jgi:hypothetical protein
MNRLRKKAALNPAVQRRAAASGEFAEDFLDQHNAAHDRPSSASAAARTAFASNLRYLPRTTTGSKPARAFERSHDVLTPSSLAISGAVRSVSVETGAGAVVPAKRAAIAH